MSNRRKLQAPSGGRYRGHVDRLDPSSQSWAESVEEWRRARELADQAYANELMMMAVEDDEPTDPTLARIDAPGPEITHPWRVIIVCALILGFVALAICGVVAWIVEALT